MFEFCDLLIHIFFSLLFKPRAAPATAPTPKKTRHHHICLICPLSLSFCSPLPFIHVTHPIKYPISDLADFLTSYYLFFHRRLYWG